MRRLRSVVPLVLLVVLGGAGLPLLAQSSDLGTDQQRAKGQQLYDKYCSQCHGVNGDGVGHATYRVKPQPRDFTSGKYKFRTTPGGMMPTDEDVKRVIRDGLPYTSMPGWPMFSEQQLQNIVYYLKTFSEDFQNPDKLAGPIAIPEPPAISEESVTRGEVVYGEQGCGACHGTLGRGDGLSARTLQDEWGNHIRPADMSRRWTFRGGPTRKDIFRTFSTGVNGTPMPSYYDAVPEEDRWDLVNYVYSLGESDTPDYDSLLLVDYVEDEIDLASADELFAAAPEAHFPLIGQIIEPGRNFYPAATSVVVQAVYNRREIAFRVRWNDMYAETTGSNSPTLVVPTWDEDNPTGSGSGEGEDDGGGFWGEEEAGDEAGFWGEEVDEGGQVEQDGGDFWGEEVEEGADDGSFSDAVALQFPSKLPTGIRKPYFIFGDTQNSVDLWFVDLARGDRSQQMIGRGSASVERSETDEIQVVSQYDQGRWTVLFKRELKARGGITFTPDTYVPIAFSVWDGFNRERGNKRALSAWFYLYTEPEQIVSPWGPMLRAAGFTLLIEILLIFWVRRRHATRAAEAAEQSVAGARA